MSDFADLVNEVEGKVRKLINQKKELEEKIDQLKFESEKNIETLKRQEIEIEELKEKNKILRIAGSQKGTDNREIKLKINEIVREVDKCIAQLNQ